MRHGHAVKVNPKQYDVFIGMDVDKRHIAMMVQEDEKCSSLNIKYDSQQLLQYLAKHHAGRKVVLAYEAGPTGFGLYDDLMKAGHHCVVASPAMIPRAPGDRVKTNRLDARKICENLRGGQLKGIRVPQSIYRDLRHLVRLRDGEVEAMKSAKYRIHSLLLCEGLSLPGTMNWTERCLQQLVELPCRSETRYHLDQLLASLRFHRQQAQQAHREIKRFCLQEEELRESVTWASSVSGIGSITATHLVARIGDWRLMGNVRELSAFIGLVCSEHSTGEHTNRGPITRMGDSRLRSKLLQAAWMAILKDPELREFFNRIRSRNPKDRAARVAIIAVARKLTMRLHAVLTQRRPYQIRPSQLHTVAAETRVPGYASMPHRIRENLRFAVKTENPGAPEGLPLQGRILSQ